MILTRLARVYRLDFAKTIIYMLQASEYQIKPYLKWLWRTTDFDKVAYRKSLDVTGRSKFLLLALQTGILGQYLVALALGIWSLNQHSFLLLTITLIVLLISPVLWAHLAAVPVLAGRWFIIKPYYKLEIKRARKILSAHQALKIAVAGSYGKTSMKEILLTVLSEGKKVAATPANKNVAISHAQFAKTLGGDEEILVIEYGEGAPGDVTDFAKYTRPNMGIITGLAPAHLDKYKSLEAAGEDIFSLADYLKDQNVYVNSDSQALKPFLKKQYSLYNFQQAAGWKITDLKSDLEGTSFIITKNKKTLKLKSDLVGEHQAGPLALAAVLALKLGLTEDQVRIGVAKTRPFEHRFQPRQLSGGWLLDDTYNGNIDGMLAGLKFLKQLPAKRKIYVTPGLVDQGPENQKVHHRLGMAIADTNPDMVILMKNSVTDLILAGINENDYKGKLIIEDDPLDFYTHLDQFIAAGDIVLLQNDWPDNYN